MLLCLLCVGYVVWKCCLVVGPKYDILCVHGGTRRDGRCIADRLAEGPATVSVSADI